jgi:hypothetical protein
MLIKKIQVTVEVELIEPFDEDSDEVQRVIQSILDGTNDDNVDGVTMVEWEPIISANPTDLL